MITKFRFIAEGGDNMQKIIVNKIKCKHCGDVIESTTVHEFVTCRCGKCSADGGKSYIRRCFESDGDFEELSEFEEVPDLF